MPPNIPAEAPPLDADSIRLRLAATLLAHRPTSLLLYDADAHLQQVLATPDLQKSVYEGARCAPAHVQRIDFSHPFQGSAMPEAQADMGHDGGPDLLQWLPDLAEVDLVYIADPILLASAINKLFAEQQAPAAAISGLARRLLSVFRDRVQVVYVASGLAESATAGLGRSDFFSLGFVDASHEIAGSDSLYRYSLRNYKAVPGWLNSKYWAHPERWDAAD